MLTVRRWCRANRRKQQSAARHVPTLSPSPDVWEYAKRKQQPMENKHSSTCFSRVSLTGLPCMTCEMTVQGIVAPSCEGLQATQPQLKTPTNKDREQGQTTLTSVFPSLRKFSLLPYRLANHFRQDRDERIAASENGVLPFWEGRNANKT